MGDVHVCVWWQWCWEENKAKWGRRGCPKQRWVTVLCCMCWEGFYEMVTFEQRPKRSEHVTLRGKRFLNEKTTAGTDTDKWVCSVCSQNSKSPMWLEGARLEVGRYGSRRGVGGPGLWALKPLEGLLLWMRCKVTGDFWAESHVIWLPHERNYEISEVKKVKVDQSLSHLWITTVWSWRNLLYPVLVTS